MKQLVVFSFVFAALASLSAAQRVLFIRGGEGTVGFFEGGADEQGADIFNYATNGGNHGWGELNAALVAEGFSPEQVAENPVAGGVPTPIALESLDLSQYAVIVFGSNNAEYSTAQVDALLDYVENGGAALFISDANFGQNWGDAPSSDQHFLDRFGLIMNQDQGTYAARRSNEFVVPAHPILLGVDSFDGEGVSPISRGAPPVGVTSVIVAQARNSLRQNTGSGQGSSRSVTADDASLVVATFGSGRIAGHYDRNTFFNQNGAGTNLNRLDNEAYARNLFNWLAGKSTATDNYTPRGHFPNIVPGTTVAEGSSLGVEVIAKDLDGTVDYVELSIDGALVSRDSAAPFEWDVSGLVPGNRAITAKVVDDDGAATDVVVEVIVVDLPDQGEALDRGGWALSSDLRAGELGNAIDGDLSSRWPTGQFQRPGQLFGIDFGQREIFQRLLLETPSNSEDYPRGYIVRGSDDGVTFTVLTTGAGNGATTDIFLPEPVTYRYVEIEQTGTSSNRWWSIDEINVYHPPVDAVLSLSAWSQFYYGSAPDGLLVDGDGDGMTTLEEYAFNTDPLVPSAGAGLVVGTGFDDGRFVDVTFRRWRDISGVEYVIEVSDDLVGWTAGGVEFVGEPMANGDGTETVTGRLVFGVGDLRKFVRLRLVRQ